MQAFRLDGTPILSWGRRGTGPGELIRPFGITVMADGTACVTDAAAPRVQCFDAEWRLHSTIVRVGAVLVGITVVEIRSGTGVEPLFDIAAVGEITTAAVAKL